MSRRRGQIRATRSSNEYGGKISYYCTGGAGDRAAAEAARTGLTWLPDGGHGPVAVERGPDPGRTVRCPVCGLTKPLGYKRRRAIRDAGLTEVDISALPF
jgi:transcription elongation factor